MMSLTAFATLHDNNKVKGHVPSLLSLLHPCSRQRCSNVAGVDLLPFYSVRLLNTLLRPGIFCVRIHLNADRQIGLAQCAPLYPTGPHPSHSQIMI